MSSPNEPGAPRPGWYDDGHGAMRWWDGLAWTEHVAARDAATTVTATIDEPIPVASVADAAPPAVRPRRWWILWLILGVVLVGVVIALVLLIPLMRTAVPAEAAPSAASPAPGAGSTEAPVAYVPATPEEQAAADVLDEFQQAWWTGDCEAYLATTAEPLREAQEFTDCEAFLADARLNVGWNDDFEWTITAMELLGPVMTVYVTESYTSRWDVDAQAQTDELVDYEYDVKYTLTSPEDGWTIRDVVDVSE